MSLNRAALGLLTSLSMIGAPVRAQQAASCPFAPLLTAGLVEGVVAGLQVSRDSTDQLLGASLAVEGAVERSIKPDDCSRLVRWLRDNAIDTAVGGAAIFDLVRLGEHRFVLGVVLPETRNEIRIFFLDDQFRLLGTSRTPRRSPG